MSIGLPLFVAIGMDYENGDKQRQTKRQHAQGMLNETDPLSADSELYVQDVEVK